MVDRRDIVIQFLRASGPGGQHRNKTETGVRLRHIPTGIVVTATERRSRRQNLEVAFGDGKTTAEKRRILRTSFRGNLRSVVLLLHISPMTRRRYRRWVDVPDEVIERLREYHVRSGSGVVVSGHVGSWELLLGLMNHIQAFAAHRRGEVFTPPAHLDCRHCVMCKWGE